MYLHFITGKYLTDEGEWGYVADLDHITNKCQSLILILDHFGQNVGKYIVFWI